MCEAVKYLLSNDILNTLTLKSIKCIGKRRYVLKGGALLHRLNWAKNETWIDLH